MNQNRFHNGFTLVEISIVMIIIGLLIGGIFGGMKLIDNANVQKTIQDIKAIESGTLTFRDTYRALPGDIRTPNTRIPNCTVAPCAIGGNGDRIINNLVSHTEVITATMEKFTFWHHLQAANLLQMDYSNTADMNFGVGSPSAPIGSGGYVLFSFNGQWAAANSYFFNGAVLAIFLSPSSGAVTPNLSVPCELLRSVDLKIDDGMPFNGSFQGFECGAPRNISSNYDNNVTGHLLYDLKGF